MHVYKATNMDELVRASCDIQTSFKGAAFWSRGHPDEKWDLCPSLYRKGIHQNEANMNAIFRNMARTRYSNCPSNDDRFGWICLMQHYQMPTRLLDWSSALLIGLFFAIEPATNDNTDGALWALEPVLLSHHQKGKPGIYINGSKDLEYILAAAFNKQYLGKDTRILPIHTEQRDLRQLIQQSAFTIHGNETPINKLPRNDDFLAKIIIPKECKDSFRRILRDFGVRREVLFPDLVNLAFHVSSQTFLPSPPPEE